MMVDLIFGLILILSLLTVIVAFKLIKVTEHKPAWILITIGLLVVSFRRIFMFLERFIETDFLSSPYLTPAAALIMSVTLFLGLLLVFPVLQKIKGSELRYRSIFDTSGVSIWEEDLSELYRGFELIRKNGITDIRFYLKNHPEFVDKSIESIRVIDVNQTTLDLFKFDNKNVLFSSIGSTFTEKSREVFIEYLISIYNGNKVFESENEFVDAEGNIINAIVKIITPKDRNSAKHSIVSITDIGERFRTERKLVTVLNEKNTLLKELYHRTKNNMQVIISMLNLHSYNIDNKIVSTAFDEMIGRIESMSLVHEKLFKSENLSVIKLDDYIDELIPLLTSTGTMWDPEIQIILDLDSVLVDIDTAIPCGLIINELLSNIYKHAFINLDSGVIQISLHNLEEDKVEIIVEDNGIGLAPGFDLKKSETLGVQTIVALGEDQLNGTVNTVSTQNSKGVAWRLVFPNISVKPRI